MNVLKYFLSYLLRRKQLAFGVVILTIISQIMELTIPLILGWTIDEILKALEEDRFHINIALTGAMIIVVIAVIRGIIFFIGRYMGYIQGESAIYEIRKDLFEQYENSSLSFFDKHHTGDLMARATTDLEPMSEFMIWGQRVIIQAVVSYIGIYLVLFTIDIRLFLLIGIVSPTLLILAYSASQRLGPLFFEIRTQYGHLTTIIQENISGMQIVRAFNAENREKEKFNKDNLAYRDLRAEALKIRSIYLPMVLFLINLLITILIFLG
ncbi:MAG: ABC transporter transmembrane domain-containing protein, partial [Candidatus Hodarchaeota archaeon]